MKAKVREFIEKNKTLRASPKIQKITDSQRLLARYIQMYERDEITDTKMRTLAYACKTYAEIGRINIDVVEIENINQRIEAIEKAYNEKGN